MYKRLLGSALLFGMAALAPPATAANCAPRAQIIETLTTTYGERLVARGVQNSLSVIEVWASDETGSFTVMISGAGGISCIVSAGRHWESVPPPTPPAGVAG